MEVWGKMRIRENQCRIYKRIEIPEKDCLSNDTSRSVPRLISIPNYLAMYYRLLKLAYVCRRRKAEHASTINLSGKLTFLFMYSMYKNRYYVPLWVQCASYLTICMQYRSRKIPWKQIEIFWCYFGVQIHWSERCLRCTLEQTVDLPHPFTMRWICIRRVNMSQKYFIMLCLTSFWLLLNSQKLHSET